jgi:hypothetical protein
MKMVISCFDESGHFCNSDYLSVAGYVSDEFGWRVFSQEWEKVLRRHGMDVLHMREFMSREGRSPECKWEDTKKIDVLREFIKVASGTSISPGLGISLDAKHYRQLTSMMKEEDLLKKPFQAPVFCFARIIRQLMDSLQRLKVDEPTTVVFDDSRDYSMKCYAYLCKLKDRRPDIKRKIACIAFGNDSLFYPLQVADLLAYATNDQIILPEPWKEANVFSGLFKSENPDFGVVGYGEKFGPENSEEMIRAIYSESLSKD